MTTNRSSTAACIALATCITLGGTLILSGCHSGETGDVAGESTSAASQLFGKWTLNSLPGNDLSKLATEGSNAPELTFSEDGKVFGHSSVNRLMSSVDLAGLPSGRFSMSQAASTRMAGPPVADKVERAFLLQLTRADSFRISGDELTLLKASEKLMSFVRAN